MLHLCFELTQRGNSIMGILPGLSAGLRKDRDLLRACLPSMALLAQLSPQHAADAIMDHMLSLCSGLDGLPTSLKGSTCQITQTSDMIMSMHSLPVQPLDITWGRARLLCCVRCKISTFMTMRTEAQG